MEKLYFLNYKKERNAAKVNAAKVNAAQLNTMLDYNQLIVLPIYCFWTIRPIRFYTISCYNVAITMASVQYSKWPTKERTCSINLWFMK